MAGAGLAGRLITTMFTIADALYITTEIAECFLLFCFSVFVSRFIDPSDFLRLNQAYDA